MVSTAGRYRRRRQRFAGCRCVRIRYVTYSDDDGGGGLLEGYTTGRLVTDNEGVFEVFGLLPDTDARLHAELDDGQVSSTVTVNIDPGFTQENIVLRMQ